MKDWWKRYTTGICFFAEGESGEAEGDWGTLPPGTGAAEGAIPPATPTLAEGATPPAPPTPAEGAVPPVAPVAPVVDPQVPFLQRQLDSSLARIKEYEGTIAKLLQGQGGQPPMAPTGPDPNALPTIDAETLAKYDPVVQAMYQRLVAFEKMFGDPLNQLVQSQQQMHQAAETEFTQTQYRQVQEGFNTYITGELKTAGLPNEGFIPQMVNRMAMDALNSLYNKGYTIDKPTLDHVVKDIVGRVAQEWAPAQTPTRPNAPPRTPNTGGPGPANRPATVAERKAAIEEALKSTSNLFY